mmetsp:Transcript_7692/g.21901  ORF Transcript_7692/g.21901 Transcript_7692/m.21901 type:complete len:170 (+) Transcript_7692:101-610(+)
MTIDPQLLTGLGAALSIFLASAGSAIASSHSGIYAVRGKDLKAFPPIIISGVLAIYGIIVSVILVGKFKDDMTQTEGYRNLSAGLSVGLACCVSGLGMASFMRQINEHSTVPSPPITSDTPEREPLVGRRMNGGINAHEPVNFIHLLLSLVFLEAIGLYGLVVALFLMG